MACGIVSGAFDYHAGCSDIVSYTCTCLSLSALWKIVSTK